MGHVGSAAMAERKRSPEMLPQTCQNHPLEASFQVVHLNAYRSTKAVMCLEATRISGWRQTHWSSSFSETSCSLRQELAPEQEHAQPPQRFSSWCSRSPRGTSQKLGMQLELSGNSTIPGKRSCLIGRFQAPRCSRRFEPLV